MKRAEPPGNRRNISEQNRKIYIVGGATIIYGNDPRQWGESRAGQTPPMGLTPRTGTPWSVKRSKPGERDAPAVERTPPQMKARNINAPGNEAERGKPREAEPGGIKQSLRVSNATKKHRTRKGGEKMYHSFKKTYKVLHNTYFWLAVNLYCFLMLFLFSL